MLVIFYGIDIFYGKQYTGMERKRDMHTPRSVVFGVSGISIALELEPRIIDWHKAGKPHGNSVCAIFSFILFILIDCFECCHTGKMTSTTTAKAKRTRRGRFPWKHNWQASEQGNSQHSESKAKMFCFLYDSMGAVAHTRERQRQRQTAREGNAWYYISVARAATQLAGGPWRE